MLVMANNHKLFCYLCITLIGYPQMYRFCLNYSIFSGVIMTLLLEFIKQFGFCLDKQTLVSFPQHQIFVSVSIFCLINVHLLKYVCDNVHYFHYFHLFSRRSFPKKSRKNTRNRKHIKNRWRDQFECQINQK